MHRRLKHSVMSPSHVSRARVLPVNLERQWINLCRQYLPVPSASIWRYSRDWLPTDPAQGWKLHISGTILNAGRVLSKVAPTLRHHDLLYKAPASLFELEELNRGVVYGYSQVGKFITVYPRTAEDAVLLAEQLHLLTQGIAGPSIPFDGRYRSDGCIYYRYGAFKNIGDSDGKIILDPDGKACKDGRDGTIKPAWAADLFLAKETDHKAAAATLLKTRFRAFRALAQ
ncbi:MAG TPA: hypothetical protein VHP99_00480, partial [Pyrinomonadaceae bacterium]|nr:hypothetical protein [Pyrinomonadaceae bacterium]